MCGNEVCVKKQKTDLTLFSVMHTTKATLIGLRYNLYHFEAKTESYNVYEDHLVQCIVYLGQNFELLNQKRTNRSVNRAMFKQQ